MKKSLKILIIFFVVPIITITSIYIVFSDNTSKIIKNDENLTWWTDNRYTHVSNMGNSEVYSELMSVTGIDVTFIHPPKGEHRERFLSLIDDTVLPDIISHDFINDYPGGPEKALNDGIIIPLNDIIDKYCPNLKKYLEENPEVRDLISTADGHIFCFPSIQKEKEIRTYMGPFIRTDYLEAVNMNAPETINEWHDVLSAFKNQLNITPLAFYGGKIIDTDFMIGAYGISWNLYVEDGEVKFGPMEEGFEDFINEFKAWYQEGLITDGVFTDANNTYSSKAKKGEIGIYVDYISSISVYQDEIENSEFEALNYPVLNEGEIAFSGHLSPIFIPYASAYLTEDNKNTEASATLLDYAYSEEGSLLFNFGILDESYELINGEPYYTDLIINDEDGFSNAVKRYLASGPFIRDEDQFEQMLALDIQKEAISLWSDTQADEHQLSGLILSTEQAEAVANFNLNHKDILLEWIKDYCQSDDNITVDDLRDSLINSGILDIIKIYQEVLDEE